ncbi:MAG: hypothetical protein KZQ83_11330 [gamma proteobacterium symbiont of Taylorina sp.]|nr:hypothetical protein [gamma proteobacterium symbiont of Taylorina sp.]
MSDKRLLFFILQVIVLFFLLLVLLYWIIPLYNILLSLLVEPVLINFYPKFIRTVSANNEILEIVTNFSISGQPQSRLAFDINPLKYSYGLPLFIALIVSSKGLWQDKVWSIMIAFFVLLLAQTWSLCFDITRHLLFEFQGAYAPYFNYDIFARGFVSLGSQLGFLLFPTLIPIILWIILMPDFFKKLTHSSD